VLYSSLSAAELVRVCAQTDERAAWEEFVRRFQRLIGTVAIRTARHWVAPSQAVLDDLVQETYLKLCAEDCRLLREFRPSHEDSIFGYLKVVTASVVNDHFKSLRAEKRGAGHAEDSLDGLEPLTVGGGAWSRTIERNILLQEIDRLLIECAPGPEHGRNRTIFWLYYRQGLSASAIAEIPSIALSTKGVESTLLRLTRMLRNRLVEGSTLQHDSYEKARRAGEGVLPKGSF